MQGWPPVRRPRRNRRPGRPARRQRGDDAVQGAHLLPAQLGGTGKYEGVKGEGTYRGRRYGNGMSTINWEGTQVLPD